MPGHLYTLGPQCCTAQKGMASPFQASTVSEMALCSGLPGNPQIVLFKNANSWLTLDLIHKIHWDKLLSHALQRWPINVPEPYEAFYKNLKSLKYTNVNRTYESRAKIS